LDVQFGKRAALRTGDGEFARKSVAVEITEIRENRERVSVNLQGKRTPLMTDAI